MTALNLYTGLFNPTVRIRSGRKCSWSHHFVSNTLIDDVVFFYQGMAANNDKRFVYARWKEAAKKHGKYGHSGKSRTTITRVDRFLRDDLHIISERGKGFNQYGNIVSGFVLADHDKCCHVEGNYCVFTMPEKNPATPTPRDCRCTLKETQEVTQAGRNGDAEVMQAGRRGDAEVTQAWRRGDAKGDASSDASGDALSDALGDAGNASQIPLNLEHTGDRRGDWQALGQPVGQAVGNVENGKNPSYTIDRIETPETIEKIETLDSARPSASSDAEEINTNGNGKRKDSRDLSSTKSVKSKTNGNINRAGKEKQNLFRDERVATPFGTELLASVIEEGEQKGFDTTSLNTVVCGIAPIFDVNHPDWDEFIRNGWYQKLFGCAVTDVWNGYQDENGKDERSFSDREVTPARRSSFMFGIMKRFQYRSDGVEVPSCWVKVANDYRDEAKGEKS